MAQRGERSQRAREVKNVAGGTARLVDGDRPMVLSLEDRPHQRAELRVGAHFEERSCSHPVHRFDLGDEFNRPGKLTGENRPCRRCVSRIGQRGRVCKHRNRRGREIDRIEHRAKRILGADDQPAVKGPRDADRAGRHSAAAKIDSPRLIAATGPETTHWRGAFLLAITSSRAFSSSTARTSSIGANTASMAPASSPLPEAVMSWPRWAASKASDRSSNRPAARSAVSSPKLCPPASSGRTPKSSRMPKRPRLTAPIAGCACRVSRRACSCSSRS